MKFREWFETQQKADVLCWADEEAAATAWGAALELAANVADAYATEREEMARDAAKDSEDWRCAVYAKHVRRVAADIRALKEQA